MSVTDPTGDTPKRYLVRTFGRWVEGTARR